MSWWTVYHATWRLALIQELGGICREADGTCGGALELDHIHGRAYDVAKLSSHMRVKRYRAEAAAGLLQVLCRTHNARKGNLMERRHVHTKPARPALEAVPAWVTEESP